MHNSNIIMNKLTGEQNELSFKITELLKEYEINSKTDEIVGCSLVFNICENEIMLIYNGEWMIQENYSKP